MQQDIRHRINAGRVALLNQVEFFERNLGLIASEWKEDDTRVTFADFAISEKIFAELRTSFPQDEYFSEESNPQDEAVSLSAPFAWMLDPIDGTNNYFLGIPTCAIALAILYKGTPIYGFIYDLSRKRLIQGGPKHPTQDGNDRGKVKSAESFVEKKQRLIALHFPVSTAQLEQLKPVLTEQRIRCIGSAALGLAHAAIGKLDGCIDYKVKVWDVAAGYALLRGAGGEFHFIGEPVFPLKSFSVNLGFTPFYAGSPAFCDFVRNDLNLTLL